MKIEELTRSEIRAAVSEKQNQIVALNNEIKNLERDFYLLSDEEQWFTEKMETFTFRQNRKKVTQEKLVGRIHWKETFIDDDDPNSSIEIERSCIVRINGNWDF